MTVRQIAIGLVTAVLVCLFPISVQAQTTAVVTGDLKTILGENLGSRTFVNFRLRHSDGSFPVSPRVIGVGMVVQTTKRVKPDSNGLISTTLFRNDVIEPAGTFWTVEYHFNGRFQHSQNFNITGATLDLNNDTPITVTESTALVDSIIRQDHTQFFTSLTTWTINHNFNSSNVTCHFFDTIGDVFYPDRSFPTDTDTWTGTFITAESGKATCSSNGLFSFSENLTQVLNLNPSGSQTGGNGQTFTWDGTISGADSSDTINGFGNAWNVRKCDTFAGADAGAKIAACIADLPSTGGVADARGFEGAQTIGSTVSIAKRVRLRLGCAVFSGTPDPLIFVDSDGGGDGTVIEGSGDCSVLRPTGTTNRAILVSGVAPGIALREQIIIQDLAIQSGTSGSSTAGLQLEGLSVFKIENVYIDGLAKMDNCFRMTAAQQGEVSGGKAFGCTTGALLESDAGGTIGSNGIDWHGMSFNNATTNLLVAASPGVGANDLFFHANHLTAAAIQIDISTDVGQINIISNHLEPLAGNNGAIVRSGKVAFIGNSFFGFPGTKDIEILTGSQVKITNNLIVADVIINAGALDTMLGFNNTGGTITDNGTRTRNWMNRAFAGSPLTTSVIQVDFLPGLPTLDLGADAGGSRWQKLFALEGDFTSRIQFATGFRRAVSNLITEATGHAYGMEQVSAAQSGTNSALRLFTSALASSDLVLGKYTDATTFVDFATFDNSGNLKLEGSLSHRDAQTLAASTTPSVIGGNVFLTNNTASITDFTGEINGQVITLLCGADTTTSLTDSTPLFLAGVFTCTADDTITLVSNGTVWFETSRSVN